MLDIGPSYRFDRILVDLEPHGVARAARCARFRPRPSGRALLLGVDRLARSGRFRPRAARASVRALRGEHSCWGSIGSPA
ncbi:MAG: hypothetical protein M3Y87_34445, partial [Myxococcota bacterium]|nr:hypothetical protein [Myxococcota bacterium]